MRTLLVALVVLVSGLLLAGTAPSVNAQSTPTATPAIRGTIEFTNGMILSPIGRVEVEIIDITGTDGQTSALGRQRIDSPVQAPVTFEVTYDAAAVQTGHAYALRVRVYDFGRLMLATVDPPLVITNGNPTSLTVYVHDVGTL
jgi:uncharacterized lipoprotein YbaY